MHENQFAYPASDGQHNSVDPQMVNLYSAIAAAAVLFNSDWNRRSFLDGVEQLFRRLPDGIPKGTLELYCREIPGSNRCPLMTACSSVKRNARTLRRASVLWRNWP